MLPIIRRVRCRYPIPNRPTQLLGDSARDSSIQPCSGLDEFEPKGGSNFLVGPGLSEERRNLHPRDVKQVATVRFCCADDWFTIALRHALLDVGQMALHLKEHLSEIYLGDDIIQQWVPTALDQLAVT